MRTAPILPMIFQPRPLRSSRPLRFTLFLALLAAVALRGQTAREVLEESDRRTKSESQFYEGTVRVVGADGRSKVKSWRSWRLGTGGSARSIVQFLSPAEVRGVGLYSQARAGGEDDQWLYTPALARDRRIAGAAKTERFLGTDFTYEDMQERDLDGADYEFRPAVSCGAARCWVIESRPKKAKKSQYKRTVITLRQTDYAVLGVILEKPDGTLRTLTYERHETVQGVLVARTMLLVDPARKSTTTLTLETVKFRLPLKPDFFNRQNLTVIHPAVE